MGLNADAAVEASAAEEADALDYIDPEVAIAQAQHKKVAGAKVRAVLKMLAKEAEVTPYPTSYPTPYPTPYPKSYTTPYPTPYPAPIQFMINPEVMKSIEGVPDADVDLLQAETLLRSLGIKSEERLNQLITYFFKVFFCTSLLLYAHR